MTKSMDVSIRTMDMRLNGHILWNYTIRRLLTVVYIKATSLLASMFTLLLIHARMYNWQLR